MYSHSRTKGGELQVAMPQLIQVGKPSCKPPADSVSQQTNAVEEKMEIRAKHCEAVEVMVDGREGLRSKGPDGGLSPVASV